MDFFLYLCSRFPEREENEDDYEDDYKNDEDEKELVYNGIDRLRGDDRIGQL